MLILSVWRSEKVLIGDRISVMLVDVRGAKVRLGFDVPEHIPVDREDVRQRIIASGGDRRVQRQAIPSSFLFVKKTAVWLQGAIEAAKATGDDKLPVYESMLAEATAVIEAESLEAA